MKFFVLIAGLFLFYTCEWHRSASRVQEPVAKVFDAELPLAEIKAFVPDGSSKDDSILMSQNYIRNWITKQLLLHKAIENLSEEEKNIQKQVEDYRTSLLIHRYKQKLIAQKIQNNINEDEVHQYYLHNKENFILTTPVVKALFFVIPKSASKLEDVRKWYKSEKEEDWEKLEDYCITNAKKYDNFNNKWIELKYILYLVPEDVDNLEKELRYKKSIEKEDEDNYYFLKIKEIYPEQTIAPEEYVKEEIVLILKNKKKLNFESELEKQINEEAVRKNYVKIY